ncbi:2'-5' RNA ligase family protein [Skermania sp. ID1734]|uniref:2'-5' RNA ligase family protein n=1 Tax=Skermania sp. ID1734 TaxID=2597516 RepID=UPI00117D3170|nr:2'-5' RNA ligase family protein [Skermania sp. ID1734]TSD98054.1 2'-5' RNA ligase family protein [Skermania sp. ID1734]
MVQSVELLLDDATDAKIRAQWQALARAGLPSLARNQAETNRPHITAAVADEIWPRVDRALERSLEFSPIPVRLGGVVVFGGHRAILVRLVVPSEALLQLHRQIYELVRTSRGVAAHTAPGEWTPHITLARRVGPEQIGPAVSTVLRARDMAGSVVGIRRWDGENRREWLIASG